MSFKNLRQAKKSLTLKDFRHLHTKAEQAVTDLNKSELQLIKILQLIESNMVHRWCGYNSLFEYGVQCLKLSRSQSYMYASLAKATKQYKKLEKALGNNTVTPSKAARVLSVINKDNEQEWIVKASTLPKSQLEKEIVRLNPKKLRGERSEYLTTDVIDMKTPVSEEVYKMLVQVQDLLSTAKGKAVTMEEVFKSLAAEYIEKHDPVRKAERITKKKELIKIEKTKAKNSGLKNYIKQFATKEELTKNIKQHATKVEIKNNKKLTSTKIEITKNIKQPVTKIELNKNIDSAPIKSQPATNSLGQRTAIPAEIAHKVHLRDQGQCRHHYPSGERCNTKRWLHLHHKQPVSQGGEHSVDNLISLCPAHHELAHLILENVITKEQICPGKIFTTKNI